MFKARILIKKFRDNKKELTCKYTHTKTMNLAIVRLFNEFSCYFIILVVY